LSRGGKRAKSAPRGEGEGREVKSKARLIAQLEEIASLDLWTRRALALYTQRV
jgi:hypothetical protein